MHRTLCTVGVLLVFSAGTLAVAANQATPSPNAPHHAHLRGAGRRHGNDPCASLPSRWQRAQCFDFHHSAPGDEYFGRMKISYLGIDNTAHDVAIEAGAYTTDPRLIARMAFADEALRQWEHRYPGDPQLARSYFLMAEALRKIYTIDAQQLAWQYMQHVIHTYPSTYFAKVLQADVARGFTEHWFAVAQACPPPLPAIDPRHPRALPTPTETPEAMATDTPTPTPPGEPNVDVITPSCVQPAPPSDDETAPPYDEGTPPPTAEPT
jgi:hypothetical protein